ncbi:MAG: hypothetical protein PHO00_08130 [bacterium]|nr:hypothetical protein [bacterium]
MGFNFWIIVGIICFVIILASSKRKQKIIAVLSAETGFVIGLSLIWVIVCILYKERGLFLKGEIAILILSSIVLCVFTIGPALGITKRVREFWERPPLKIFRFSYSSKLFFLLVSDFTCHVRL